MAATKARTARNKIERRIRYQKIKEATPCTDCGGYFPYYVTHYDHLDSATKVGNVSRLAAVSASEARLNAEIDKCELVCANCHAIRTHKRRVTAI